MAIKLLIADDHAVVRDGLATILNLQKDFSVIGQADDGRTAIAQATKLRPDVVIMDLMMPVMDGVEATRTICRDNPDVKVLLLTTYASSARLKAALDVGVAGALSKTCPKEELFSAIRDVAAGKRVLSSEIRAFIKSDSATEDLSPRQMQMLQSIVRGLSNKDIAQEYGLSLSAVKFHLIALFRKLGAANRTEATAIALQRHLLKV